MIKKLTISAFVILMLSLTALFVMDYQRAKQAKLEAQTTIKQIEEHNARLSVPPPPPPPQRKTERDGKEHKIAIDPPVTVESKIEIDAGLIKIAMSDEASWMAIFKIVFTLLFTFFGVRAINFGFSRLENKT